MVGVKLDENVPDAVAGVLRASGHDVALARGEGLGGAADLQVLARATVLRPHRPLLLLIMSVARSVGQLLGSEEVAGRLWVADEMRLRVWPG